MPVYESPAARAARQAEHDAWIAVRQQLADRGIDLDADGELATTLGLWGAAVLAIAIQRLTGWSSTAPRPSPRP